MIKKVFVGLSGGVDSAVSAALLKRAGFDVTGVFIRIVLPGYPCPAVQDRQEAMRVAAHLRIPFHEIDLSAAYKEKVFAYSIKEFALGRTPNPDTLCNREVKFGLFFDYAMEQGADFVATGHYARTHTSEVKVSEEKSRRGRAVFLSRASRLLKNGAKDFSEGTFTELVASVDSEKDQSYFLWMVPEKQLSKTLFPVGDKKKSEVRALAKKFGLPNAARHDSQGLCFLGDISIGDMLERELHPAPGDVLAEDGKVIGRHEGAILYTLGQRHGFTVSGKPHTEQLPHYVIAKNIEANTITVSEHKYPQTSTATEVTLSDCNWIGNVTNGKYLARFRYRQTLMPATLTIDDRGARATLHVPQYIPEGQSLVLYDGARCLGGGVVDKSALV